MHRRAVVFLVGFLVTIVVVGGGGVRAPWVPARGGIMAPSSPHPDAPRIAVVSSRVHVE
jgi:hypothetical protein